MRRIVVVVATVAVAAVLGCAGTAGASRATLSRWAGAHASTLSATTVALVAAARHPDVKDCAVLRRDVAEARSTAPSPADSAAWRRALNSLTATAKACGTARAATVRSLARGAAASALTFFQYIAAHGVALGTVLAGEVRAAAGGSSAPATTVPTTTAPPSTTTAPTTTTTAPPPTTTAPPPTTTAPPVTTTPTTSAAGGCSPLSDEGTCYQPGEYCRDATSGVTGRTATGEAIVCRTNDGLRWEPAT